jgi:hypothetical protein
VDGKSCEARTQTYTPSWEVEKTSDLPVAGKFPLIKDLVVVLTTHNILIFSTYQDGIHGDFSRA